MTESSMNDSLRQILIGLVWRFYGQNIFTVFNYFFTWSYQGPHTCMCTLSEISSHRSTIWSRRQFDSQVGIQLKGVS